MLIKIVNKWRLRISYSLLLMMMLTRTQFFSSSVFTFEFAFKFQISFFFIASIETVNWRKNESDDSINNKHISQCDILISESH